MKILVTGAAGLIGSSLVNLLMHEHDVRAIDNFSFGKIRRIGEIKVETMDVTDPAQVEDMVLGRDVVVHLAGFTGIPVCEKNPESAAVHTLVGTKYVVDAAVKAGVKQLLFASTFAVYGLPPRNVTEDTPIAPISMYGNLKSGCEHIVRAAHELDGLRSVIFRQTNVYGRDVAEKSTLISILVDRALKREPITVFGTGEQVRNFLHVRDTSLAYKLAIEQEASGLFNLGSPETVSVLDIVDTVNSTAERMLGYQVPVERKDADRGAGNREIQTTDFSVDISKVERELGFRSRNSIRSTVEELMAREPVKAT